MPILPLRNQIQPYAWGSHSVIAQLQQRPFPTSQPEAEMWLGAHPNAPSQAIFPDHTQALDTLIAEEPSAWLGASAAEFHQQLPFLLKVLAAGSPLSLQAHPNQEQARRGFEEDEALGIPKSDRRRRYQDATHKPEILCALTRFEALSGFQKIERSLAVLAQLDVPTLKPALVRFTQDPSSLGLREFFGTLLEADEPTRLRIVSETVARCRALVGKSSEFEKSFAWCLRLNELYPGDIGVVSQFLLNLIELEPGEAIYLPAGNLHAYLGGAGIELMANSDNVLRGGLTPKAVHSAELLRILDFSPLDVAPLCGVQAGSVEEIYVTEAREFQLSRLRLHQESWSGVVKTAEIWLCTEGALLLASEGCSVALTQGESAVVSANTGTLSVTGSGTLFRATEGSIHARKA